LKNHKINVQQRFGQTAQDYVTSQVHATGIDLELHLEIAQPKPDWQVLDIATGGGHTARLFAPHVQHVIATDFTLPMLHAAKDSTQTDNITFCAADAEDLPFSNNTFDLITCRIAAHHFHDCYRFVMESARCLKAGGLLLIQDHVNANDERTANYLDAFERLRDTSHKKAYAEYEWRGMFADAGLTVTDVRRLSRPAGGLVEWAQRQRCSDETIEKLQVMLHQAPPKAREILQPQLTGTPYADFVHAYIIIAGTKSR
jgi:ubiquinone/menaquinone biosynthesis C-methylase UbiE